MSRQIVLASTSPYRAELLERLGLAFVQRDPDVDETLHAGETPRDYVRRLAEAKARAVGEGELIIGADQTAVLDDRALGKPGDAARARAQLRAASGKTVRFLTGLCLVDRIGGRAWIDVVPFSVTFRALSDAAIERYIAQDEPYDCAGSFKAEGLGVTLFERMEGDDPSALIGLPLIRLVTFFNEAGVDLP